MSSLNQSESVRTAPRFWSRIGVSNVQLLGLAAALAGTLLLAAAPSHAADKIKLGMVPNTYVEAAQHIAKENGFFSKNGLDVEFITLKGDILCLRALIGKEVDFASIGSFALINAVQKGAEVKAIISTVPEQPHILVAKKEIGGWKDLPGHTFAISQPGAISQTFPRAIMKQLNIDPDKVTYLAIGGNGARQTALLAGKVDATLLHKERAVAVVTSSDKFHLIGSTSDYLKGVPLVYHTARTEWLAKNGDVAKRYVKALIEATRFMVENKDVMVKYGERVIKKASKELIAKSFEEYKKSGVWGLNGGLNKAGFDFTIKLGVETKELKAPIEFEKVVDTNYVDAVLKDLGQK